MNFILSYNVVNMCNYVENILKNIIGLGLQHLLSVENTKEFCNLGRFILMAFKIRNSVI